MKIGVITQHRIANYGSFLQAYATQVFVEKTLKCRCEIIDYCYPSNYQEKRAPKQKKSFYIFVAQFLTELGLTPTYRKNKRIAEALERCLNLSQMFRTYEDMQSSSIHYDAYITGSDQTLNPTFTFGDTNFVFSWVKDKNPKILSLSASMPIATFPKEYEADYKRCFEHYQAISVREKNCIPYLAELTGKKVFNHIDPTLMLNKEEWLKAVSPLMRYKKFPTNYIVLYYIAHSFDSAPYIYELTKSLQNKTGLKVISFTAIPHSFGIESEIIKDAGPRDFIELFANASYVITSSFHGTAFAVNFGIPLFSIVPADFERKDSRVVDFLRTVKAENSIVQIGTAIEKTDPLYDVLKSQYILKQEREKVATYLTEYINR